MTRLVLLFYYIELVWISMMRCITGTNASWISLMLLFYSSLWKCLRRVERYLKLSLDSSLALNTSSLRMVKEES